MRDTHDEPFLDLTCALEENFKWQVEVYYLDEATRSEIGWYFMALNRVGGPYTNSFVAMTAALKELTRAYWGHQKKHCPRIT